jgi:hypothetical protein
MEWFYFISMAVFAVGVSAFMVLKGFPSSISAAYYGLPENWRMPLFYGWTVLVSLPLMVFWLDVSEGTFQAPVFFSTALLAGVGLAAPFRSGGMVARVHTVCASLCAVLASVWVFIYTPFWPTAVLLAFLALAAGEVATTVDGRRPRLFFIELAAFVFVYTAVWGYYSALPR